MVKVKVKCSHTVQDTFLENGLVARLLQTFLLAYLLQYGIGQGLEPGAERAREGLD